MSSLFTPEFNLELLNGNWALAAASLMVICGAYLWHEIRARKIMPFGQRHRLTDGIKVASAIFTLSLGIFIRSAEVWRWRIAGGVLNDLNQDWLTLGGMIAIVGFLCAIREKSTPLFGRAPWLWTLVVMIGFTIGSVLHRIW